MTTFDLQAFEKLAKENGVRYWDALEFQHALGYETWASFQKVINRAIGSCAQLSIDISEVFIPKTVIESGKVINSYKLTRFACLLVTMHADSKKPEVAQAKVALAAVADALIAQSMSTDGLERLEIRHELKAGQTIMCDAAKSAGLQGQEYAIFQDAGIRGMYNMSLKELVTHKNAPKDKVLYDYMGKTELAANLFRVTQTAERLENNGASGLSKVSATAKDVGAEVRNIMLRSSGVAPEDLAIEEDIAAVTKRIKGTHREMQKLDAKPKGKLPKPRAAG